MNLLNLPLQWIPADLAVFVVFAIIAMGYILGEMKIPGGLRLGTAGVLFAGLGVGVLTPRMEIPSEFGTLGLALFVYCLGLEAGPGFFRALKKDGIRPNLAVAGASFAGAIAAWSLGRAMGIDRTIATGLFCGGLNNTAALGAAVERARAAGINPESMVAAFGLAYPAGILATLLLLHFRLPRSSSAEAPKPAALPRMIRSTTLTVTRGGAQGPWSSAAVEHDAGVILTRVRFPDGRIVLLSEDTLLPLGSLVVVIGPAERLRRAKEMLGEDSPESLEDDIAGFVVDRYHVSNPRIAGLSLGDLGIEKLGAVVSRIRRGDVDLPVADSTVLQLGDRVRAISYRSSEQAVSAFFGNSVQTLTETGYMTFAIGITMGILFGAIPFPLPGFGVVRLGAAGGPLLMGLFLGARGRTGHMVWNLPFTTNMALRQLGLIVFLAISGAHAGHALPALAHAGVGKLLASAVLVTLVSHFTLWLVLRLLGERRTEETVGYSCALLTQAAALTFAADRVERGRLNLAYATVYPLSFISKIALAQILLNV